MELILISSHFTFFQPAWISTILELCSTMPSQQQHHSTRGMFSVGWYSYDLFWVLTWIYRLQIQLQQRQAFIEIICLRFNLQLLYATRSYQKKCTNLMINTTLTVRLSLGRMPARINRFRGASKLRRDSHRWIEMRLFWLAQRGEGRGWRPEVPREKQPQNVNLYWIVHICML